MKVVLTDPKHRYDFIDIVLYENLSYTEAYRKAAEYNLNTKWYRAVIAPEIYNPMRNLHEVSVRNMSRM